MIRAADNAVKKVFILLLLIALQACMAGKQLMTSAADPAEVKGAFTLLLYGCHYPAQIQEVAILVDEASKYTVRIHDLDTSYKVKKGVPANEALLEADQFVRCSTNRIWKTRIRKILDENGGTVGYEVTPLYAPVLFGTPDVIEVSYSLQNGIVWAYIRLFPDVQRQEDQGGPFDGGRGSSDGN